MWKEKEKKEDEETQPGKEKNRERWSKVAAKVWQWVPPCNVIFENTIELWVMKTENTF